MVSLAIFVWFGLSFSFPLNVLASFLVPLVVLVLWGTFVAPKAKIKIGLTAKFLLEVLIFAGAFFYFAHFVVGVLPVIFIVVVLIVSILSKISDKLYPEGLYH
jgi:hypothetical protein